MFHPLNIQIMIPSIGLSYKTMSTPQKLDFTRNLIHQMSNDRRFVSLQPLVTDLASKLEEWELAIANAQSGGKIKTIKKIEKGLSVKDKVFYLASRVEILAEHDQTLITASGYDNSRKEVSLNLKAFSTQELEELLTAMA